MSRRTRTYSLYTHTHTHHRRLFKSFWSRDANIGWGNGLLIDGTYLTQCWLIFSEMPWHSVESDFTGMLKISSFEMCLKITQLILHLYLPGGKVSIDATLCMRKLRMIHKAPVTIESAWLRSVGVNYRRWFDDIVLYCRLSTNLGPHHNQIMIITIYHGHNPITHLNSQQGFGTWKEWKSKQKSPHYFHNYKVQRLYAYCKTK